MKKQNLILAVIIFIALVAIVWVTLDQIFPPDALPASAPTTEFSAERAIEHLKVIATEPRLVGTSGYEIARDYIIDELTALGWTTEIQNTRNTHEVENIVARIEGTKSQDAILLVAHLDSVIGGVSDPFISSRYVGFVAVVGTTVFELAIKEIFLEFSIKKIIVYSNKYYILLVEN